MCQIKRTGTDNTETIVLTLQNDDGGANTATHIGTATGIRWFQIRDIGDRVTDPAHRAAFYGELLTACSECHDMRKAER